MTASNNTIEEVLRIVAKYVSPKIRRDIVKDLLEVEGNKSFKDTIKENVGGS